MLYIRVSHLPSVLAISTSSHNLRCDHESNTISCCPAHSNDLDVVYRSKIFPAIQNDKLDHHVWRRLLDPHALFLFASAAIRELTRLADRFKAIAVRGLTSFNRHASDATGNEAHFIHNLRMSEVYCQLLRIHARRQPERVIASINGNLRLESMVCRLLTWEHSLGQTSRRS